VARRGFAGLIAAAVGAVIVAGVLALPGPTPPDAPAAAPPATLSPPRPVPRAGAAGALAGAVDPSAVVVSPNPATNGPDTGGLGVVHMMDQVEIARLGRDWTWSTVGTTAGEGSTPGASCEVTTLATLGAFDVARRDFSGPGTRSDATGGQVVGSFDTVFDARRAFRAMQSWRQSCASRMQRQGYDAATIGDFVRIDSKADTAGWWSGRFTQRGKGSPTVWTALTGIATSGTTVTVVWIETGQALPPAVGNAAIAATIRQSTELIRSSVR
jgi:hypothetical protein